MKFATLVFGIKAKRVHARAEFFIQFATLVFGIKAKRYTFGFASLA